MLLLRSLLPLLATAGLLGANVTLPAIFSDHAVLQKAAKVPIWGTADPGEKVSITLGDARAEATADATGKWQAALDLSRSGEGPFELVVEGKNKLTVADVLVGEVWVCSGQSNMAWKLGQLDSLKDEAPKADLPRLRQFAIGNVTAAEPTTELKGSWIIATPETAKNFTSVGYYFGKDLEKELQRPVGLILSAWGGTQVEPWIPQDAFSADADLQQGAENAIKKLTTWKPRFERYLADFQAWEEKHGLTDARSGTLPDETDWQPFTAETTPKEPGAAWYRHPFSIKPNQAGKPFPIALRGVTGVDQVYWNGQLVAETPLKASDGSSNRRYIIPGNQIKAGPATLLVRVYGSEQAPKMEKITAEAPWEVKVETSVPLSAEARREIPVHPGTEPGASGTASFIYNAMIHPIIPYAIAGAIWYQGESNAGRAWQYQTVFPLLIRSWREKWNQGDFPFYFCQLASFMPKSDKPEPSDWAELREAQTLTTKLPHTGQAILIDAGEAGDIHPQQKDLAGQRLAKLALNRTYQKAQPDSGPVFESAKVENEKIRVTFKSTDGGLVAKPVPETHWVRMNKGETAPLKRNRPNSEIEGFSISGADQKWVWADAKIDGDSVIVWSDAIKEPVAVRYAWANNPNANLYNGAGLPTGPFRTDDFPMNTAGKKYGIAPKPAN